MSGAPARAVVALCYRCLLDPRTGGERGEVCTPENGACGRARVNVIDSEIVIVNDDGTEEPFSPSSRFE
jgi:hypothetical protein